MRIKEHRLKKGWTQKQIAEAMGTSQQNVARWERGEAGMSPDKLIQMAGLLDCTVDDLLGNKNRRSPQFSQNVNGLPWGTLKLTHRGKEYEYPIDEDNQDQIVEWLHEDSLHDEPLTVTTMNNKVLIIDLHLIDRMDLIDDNAEEMPVYLSPDTYRFLAWHKIEGSEFDKKWAAALIEELGGFDSPGFERFFHGVVIIRSDGSEQVEHASEELLQSLTSRSALTKQGPQLLVLRQHYMADWSCIPLREAAIIELPREKLASINQAA